MVLYNILSNNHLLKYICVWGGTFFYQYVNRLGGLVITCFPRLQEVLGSGRVHVPLKILKLVLTDLPRSSKRKGWLTQIKNNVSVYGDMTSCGCLVN